MSGRPPAPRGLIWGLVAGYLALLVIGCGLLVYARQATIAALDTPQARADWQKWKTEETMRQAQGEGPVRRRAPKSDEPPGLVLMRDSFAGIVVGSVAVGSFLYGFLAWIAIEVSRKRSRPREA